MSLQTYPRRDLKLCFIFPLTFSQLKPNCYNRMFINIVFPFSDPKPSFLKNLPKKKQHPIFGEKSSLAFDWGTPERGRWGDGG